MNISTFSSLRKKSNFRGILCAFGYLIARKLGRTLKNKKKKKKKKPGGGTREKTLSFPLPLSPFFRFRPNVIVIKGEKRSQLHGEACYASYALSESVAIILGNSLNKHI